MDLMNLSLLPFLLAVIKFGVAATGPCADSSLPDGRGVYLDALTDYKDCKYLLRFYPEDRYVGIYANREYFCTYRTSTDCCSACASVLDDVKCKNGETKDGKGVFVAGADRYFECKYLKRFYEEDKYVGIYENRLDFCNQTRKRTDCCSTCADVVAENECRKGKVPDGKGVYLGGVDRYFECRYLREFYPEDKLVGIYDNRVEFCNDAKTDCCTTCANVLGSISESVENAESTKTPSENVTTAPSWTTTKKSPELTDECSNGCLWIGDGSYGRCDWLLDEVNHPDIYNMRFSLCGDGLTTGCRRTCAEVMKDKPATGTVTYSNNNNGKDNDPIIVPLYVSTTSASTRRPDPPSVTASASPSRPDTPSVTNTSTTRPDTPSVTTSASAPISVTVTSSATTRKDHHATTNKDNVDNVTYDVTVIPEDILNTDGVEPRINLFDVLQQTLDKMRQDETRRHRQFEQFLNVLFRALQQHTKSS